MAIVFPTVGALIGNAVRLANQLLDAADSAVLEEHAQYCLDVARQMWRGVCHLREGLPAPEDDRIDIELLCGGLSERLHSLELRKLRH